MNFPKIVTSDEVPEGEVWLVTPAERVQYLKPGELTHDYRVETREVDGKVEHFLVCKENGTIVETKPAQVHKIVNVGVE